MCDALDDAMPPTLSIDRTNPIRYVQPNQHPVLRLTDLCPLAAGHALEQAPQHHLDRSKANVYAGMRHARVCWSANAPCRPARSIVIQAPPSAAVASTAAAPVLRPCGSGVRRGSIGMHGKHQSIQVILLGFLQQLGFVGFASKCVQRCMTCLDHETSCMPAHQNKGTRPHSIEFDRF